MHLGCCPLLSVRWRSASRSSRPSTPARQVLHRQLAVARQKRAVPDLTPGADGKLSQEQMRQLFRVVADKDIENDKRQRDYTYIDREVKNKLDGKGQTKSTEIEDLRGSGDLWRASAAADRKRR